MPARALRRRRARNVTPPAESEAVYCWQVDLGDADPVASTAERISPEVACHLAHASQHYGRSTVDRYWYRAQLERAGAQVTGMPAR